MKNVTDNGSVPHDLSEEELQRLAEYFSILHEWSLQSKNVKDRGEDVATTDATTSVDDDLGKGRPLGASEHLDRPAT